jgi:hypothetical protein
MLSWMAKKLIARNMARASAGDLGPTLRMDAEDVRFRFPGDSSWGGELNGKAELEPWLRRFADTGLQISPDEVTYEDTQKSKALDEYLASAGDPLSRRALEQEPH